MSTFGVSSNIGACSSRIYSNPVTIAAVKRQQQKELERSPEYQAKLQAQADRVREAEAKQAIVEEKWHAEFQAAISLARKCHNETTPSDLLDLIISKYRQVGFNEEPLEKKTAEQIIREGARESGFRIEDIKGHRRYRPLVKVRQTLIAQVYVECPQLSLPQIGRAFGGLYHTTCLHAVKKMGVHYSQTGKSRLGFHHPYNNTSQAA